MSAPMTLTAEQAVEAQAVRELHDGVHARLRAANARGVTGADLTDYSDTMREIQCRENAMRDRWWPGAVKVYVSKISGSPEVAVWPMSNSVDGELWTTQSEPLTQTAW